MEGPFLPSLRQVRTFAAVARFESISRASVQLHLSQSAATQAIATLEAKLEVPAVRQAEQGYLPHRLRKNLRATDVTIFLDARKRHPRARP
jgi:DNA-binding transcriptional LysR family regulator